MRYNGTDKKEQGRMNRNQKRKRVYGTWVKMNFRKRTQLDFFDNLLKEVNF